MQRDARGVRPLQCFEHSLRRTEQVVDRLICERRVVLNGALANNPSQLRENTIGLPRGLSALTTTMAIM